MHLCEACAREKNLMPGPAAGVERAGRLATGPRPACRPARPRGDAVCPECGTPYAEFRAQGRLGCPHDYEAFRSLLEPLVERVQNGAVRHVGKVPRRHRRRLARARRVELEAELQAAVAAERYEEAARLRDAIRQPERRTDEPGQP